MRSFIIAGTVVCACVAAWIASRERDEEHSPEAHEREGVPVPRIWQDTTRPCSPFDRERDTFSMVPTAAARAIAQGGRHDGVAITSTTLAVLEALIRLTNRQTGRGSASYRQIAQAASCGKTSVVRHMRILEEHFGYIRRATSHKINPALNTVTVWTLGGVVREVVCGAQRVRVECASSAQNGGERINGDSSDESPLVTLPYKKSLTTRSRRSFTNLSPEGVQGVNDDDPASEGDLYDQMRAKHGAVVDEVLAIAEADPEVKRARGFVARAFQAGWHETYLAQRQSLDREDDLHQMQDLCSQAQDLYFQANEAGLVKKFSFRGHIDYTIAEIQRAIDTGTILDDDTPASGGVI